MENNNSLLNTIKETKEIIVAISCGISLLLGGLIYGLQYLSCMNGYSGSSTIMNFANGKVNYSKVDSFQANYCKEYMGLDMSYMFKCVLIIFIISFIVIALIIHFKLFQKIRKKLTKKSLLILSLIILIPIILLIFINNYNEKQSIIDSYYGKYATSSFCVNYVEKYSYSNSYECKEKKDVELIITKENFCSFSVDNKVYNCRFNLDMNSSDNALTINIENTNNEVPTKIICDYRSSNLYCKSKDDNFNYSDNLFKMYYEE